MHKAINTVQLQRTAERTRSPPRSNTTDDYWTVFVLSFYHVTYLHTQLLKALMQF